MCKARSIATDAKYIRDQVHTLNESMQWQLKEADMRYIELYECRKRNKEQWKQQIQSMKQRMTTMYNYFEQMRSGGSSSGAQLPPPPSPPPLSQPSLYHHTSKDDNYISDINNDQYM